MIQELFSSSVVTVEADREMWAEDLHPEEAQYVRHAVGKRKREFAAGRACARKALGILGVPPQPLLVGTHREPLWPSGIVGSLTHCNDYCAAAVARADIVASLGIDAELSEVLDPKLRTTVCAPAELEWIGGQPPPPHGDWHKVIFSAKESAYKCLHPFVLRVLEFAELEIRLQPSARRFTVRLLFEPPGSLRELPVVSGRFEVGPEYIVTGTSIDRVRADTPA